MARLKYNGYRLVPNCNGGYLVAPNAPAQDAPAYVATVRPHPERPRWWQVRPWDAPKGTAWGNYPTLREAAQAGYDERTR